ncbi:hypothetical protein CDAR_455391 [Caerostris darwini]|uniref:Uncharacterized protein n=1 Tax=Caerostris darwini TaxID=1538125 RepID=A0AAV4TNV1_9ARAC|nr:hypothetical protein CDAR_455391 [Caerostris darwini]
MENQNSYIINMDAMKFKGDDSNPKNKLCSEFNYEIPDGCSYASNSNSTHQHNFGSGKINQYTELHAWVYSASVIRSSEKQKVCNISTSNPGTT